MTEGHDSTLIIAIYGAVVSTLLLLFDVFKYFNDKPKITVKATPSLSFENSYEKKKISIKIVNSGRRPATISYCGLQLKDAHNQVIDTNLPKQLLPNESYISYSDFIESDADNIIYACVKDAMGREYRSKKWPLKGFE